MKKEIGAMLMRHMAAALVGAVVFSFAGLSAEASEKPKKRATATPKYDASLVCVQVYKGKKSVSHAVEDGLAYLLDIPLAMISPVTCPVAAPLRDWLEPR